MIMGLIEGVIVALVLAGRSAFTSARQEARADEHHQLVRRDVERVRAASSRWPWGVSLLVVGLSVLPLMEQIDPRVKNAARICGARLGSVLSKVLGPLLLPGILATVILVLVRTVGMFELAFLTAGPDSQTLVVVLYYSMSASGIRAQQSADAIAVAHTLMILVLLVAALRYVNPTQLVARVKEEQES